MAMIFGAEAT